MIMIWRLWQCIRSGFCRRGTSRRRRRSSDRWPDGGKAGTGRCSRSWSKRGTTSRLWASRSLLRALWCSGPSLFRTSPGPQWSCSQSLSQGGSFFASLGRRRTPVSPPCYDYWLFPRDLIFAHDVVAAVVAVVVELLHFLLIRWIRGSFLGWDSDIGRTIWRAPSTARRWDPNFSGPRRNWSTKPDHRCLWKEESN